MTEPVKTTPNVPHAHPRPYGKIFLALFVLTILEIVAANQPIAKIYIVIALICLALVKAGLVAMFYMHLRFEKALLFVVAFAPLIFSAIFTLMIGWDVAHPRIH